MDRRDGRTVYMRREGKPDLCLDRDLDLEQEGWYKRYGKESNKTVLKAAVQPRLNLFFDSIDVPPSVPSG